MQMADMLQWHIFAERGACVELCRSFEEQGTGRAARRVAEMCLMSFSPVAGEAAIAGEHDVSKA